MAEKERRIRVAAMQFDIAKGRIDDNMAVVEAGIRRLGDRGADLIVLPEMWSCGFDYGHLPAHAERTPEICERLSAWAKEMDVVIAGSLPELTENDGNADRVYNTLIVHDKDGSRTGRYRKIHLFSHAGEDRYFTAGDRAVVCPTSIGDLGLMICYDLRFPELCRSLALKGARIVVVCAQWPRVRIAHWDILVQARALENQLFVVVANRVGQNENPAYGGNSRIVTPTGETLAMAENDPAELIHVIDIGQIEAFRKQIPCLNERVPHAYR